MILITGGLGYIGSHIATTLMLQGHPVVVVDNLFNSRVEALKRIEAITGKPVNFQRLDVRNTPALQRVFDEFPITAVIHCSGMKDNASSPLQPLDFYNDNVGCLMSVLRVMQRSGVKNIIFTSSGTIYGEPETLPITEDSDVAPNSPYSMCNLMCEDILRDVAEAESDWRMAILRCFNVAGAHPSGILGEFPSAFLSNLVPMLAKVASLQRPTLEIHGDKHATDDGTVERDYVHVMDVVEAHLLALDWLFNQTENAFGTFNIAGGKPISVLKMRDAFALAAGVEIPVEVVDARKQEADKIYADISLAESDLKWKPKYGINEIAADMWKFYQSL